MRLADHHLGLVLLAAAVAYALQALDLPSGAPGTFGPDVFPLLIASLMGIASLCLVWRGLRARGGDDAAKNPAASPAGPRHLWHVVFVVAGLVAVVLAMPHVGFILTVGPLLAALCLLLKVRARLALPLSVLVVLGVQFIFANHLSVPLPWGLLPRLWS